MPDEPDNLVLQLLREIRAEQTQTNDRIDGLGRAVAADIHDLDAKIDTKSKDLSDQLVGLRRAVVEARVRRLKQRLGPETH